MSKVFIAYPALPPVLGVVLEAVKGAAPSSAPGLDITTWKRDDPAGSPVITPIYEAIKAADIVAADITRLNFNVTYELGYAIGLGKRGLPIINSKLENDLSDISKIGIFDTLIYELYEDTAHLLSILNGAASGKRLATAFPFDPQPLYIVLPQSKSADIGELMGRAAKAGLRARTFDPDEQPRLSAVEAVRNVAKSNGIVLPLVEPNEPDAQIHNIRCAFVAGVAHALERPTLLLQKGHWPTPLDIRDEVKSFVTLDHLRVIFQEFAERVHDSAFASRRPVAGSDNPLAALNLGDPAAENEEETLDQYFLERDEFRQVVESRIDAVVGRKGWGKTAVFFQVRDRLRLNRANVVVDLSPEAYQLKKLKDAVLRWLAAGSKEFLLAAFWEYVLLIEICGKLLEKDRDVHKRNHNLFEPYQRLLKFYSEATNVNAVSFSDRLLRLIDDLGTSYRAQFGEKTDVDVSDDQLTNLLYKTALHALKAEVVSYTRNKGEVRVLFDNIDKAWNAAGLDDSDVLMIRTLMEASRKLGNDFRKSGTQFQCTVFLRNDIYELLLHNTSDRGKTHIALVDWTQADLLKQLIRKRLLYNLSDNRAPSVEELWHKYSIAMYSGTNSLSHLIDLSMMRPRYLLRLINHCKGNATNFGRSRIDENDIERGTAIYSTDTVTEIDLEIRDVLPGMEDVLYRFLGEAREMKSSTVRQLLSSGVATSHVDAAFALLLWHGVLGFRRNENSVSYIYDVNYDLKRLQGVMAKADGGDPMMQINPALWAGLELTQSA